MVESSPFIRIYSEEIRKNSGCDQFVGTSLTSPKVDLEHAICEHCPNLGCSQSTASALAMVTYTPNSGKEKMHMKEPERKRHLRQLLVVYICNVSLRSCLKRCNRSCYQGKTIHKSTVWITSRDYVTNQLSAVRISTLGNVIYYVDAI